MKYYMAYFLLQYNIIGQNLLTSYLSYIRGTIKRKNLCKTILENMQLSISE